ncbi:MAG: phage portal protein, partial [Hyphomicrobiaceae bacterium]
PEQWLLEAFGVPSPKADVTVNASTALGLTAFWQGVRVVSEAIATLPICLYQIEENGNIQPMRSHPACRVISKSPSSLHTSYYFRLTMQAIATVRGNAYAWIERDGGARILGLHILNPWRVTPFMSSGDLYYRVDGYKLPVHHLDMLHIKGMNVLRTLENDQNTLGHIGENPIHIGYDALSVGIASQDMEANTLGSGGHIPGFLSIEGKMDAEERKKVEESFWKRYMGSRNAGRIPLLSGGMDFKKVALSPQEAMLLESRKFSVEEVARLLNIPQHKLNSLDKSSFNNIEQLSRDFYLQTVRPWAENWESELELKLLTEAEKQVGNREFRFDYTDLLRADSKTLGETIKTLSNAGILSINDGRRMMGMNSIPEDWADKHWLQIQYAPADNRPEPKASTSPADTQGANDTQNGN